MNFIMSSLIERIYSATALETNGEERTFAPPQREGRADQEIISFACEALRVYHGLREFSDVYFDDLLPKELIDNRHENTPRYERMQHGVNSLKGRVAKLAEADPRIEKLFDLMVKTVVKDDKGNEGLREIVTMVHELIGDENVIPDHPFLKHGVVCLKDDFPLDVKPDNLITETDLNKMIELKDKLLDSKSGLVRIRGDESFITDTFNNFEKLLTFPEGRELASNLIEFNRELVITRGKRDYYTPGTNSITLTKESALRYGHSTSGLTRIKLPPYITLAHELIHSLHSIAGDFKSNQSCKNPKLWTNQEELDTIGHHMDTFGLTENAFITHTFHLQRKYHNIPPALEPSQYSLDEQIHESINFNNNDAIINLIKTNELTIKQLNKIFEYIQEDIWLSPLVHLILDTSAGKNYCKDSANFINIFHTAATEDDILMVTRLFLEFPCQCEELPSELKASLVFDTLNENLELSKLLIKNNFHLEIKTKLSNTLKRKSLLESTKETLKAVVKNKELLNLSEEDLVDLRNIPGLSAEIQKLLTS